MPDIPMLWLVMGYPATRERGRGLFKRPKSANTRAE
jgi:hypothetical protein